MWPFRRLPVAMAGITLAACANPTVPAQTDRPSSGGSADASRSGQAAGDVLECRNDEIGFVVEYPAGWWANERLEPDDPGLTPIPGCTYFGPEPVELAPNAGLPSEIAIWFDVETQWRPAGEVLLQEETTVDGRETFLFETEAGQGGFVPAGSRTYTYVIPAADGSQILATTDSALEDDATYQEHREILDRMMETIDFEGA